MEAESSGKNENFVEEMFGELNELLDEIDATKPETKSLETEVESLLEKISQDTPPEVIEENKLEVESKEDQIPDQISSRNEFDIADEALANLCDSVEKQDELNKSVKKLEADIEKNINENIQVPDDEELPEVPEKEIKSGESENIDDSCETTKDISKEIPKNIEKEYSDSIGSAEEPKDSDENVILTEAPFDTTSGNKDATKELSAEMLEVSLEETSIKPEESEIKPGKNETAKEAIEDEEESSVTPEKIIDLLKKLSPAKLQDIKIQMFNKSSFSAEVKTVDVEKKHRDDENSKIKVEDASVSVLTSALPEEKEQGSIKKEQDQSNDAVKQTANTDDDCIILIDSDDEPEAENNKTEAIKPEELKQSVLKPIDNDKDNQPNTFSTFNSKRKSDETKENQNQKVLKKTKECVNPDCSHDSDIFYESPMFALSFYCTTRKWNKTQYVCSKCFEKAVDKYEELGEALLNNEPIFQVPIHTKQEMVEIIDSDEEDEEPKELSLISVTEKIDFTKDVELEIENILQGFCDKVDFKKQLTWEKKDLERRSKELEKEQLEFDKELKILEKKSTTMYNDLYAINKPKFQRKKSIEIVHEVESRENQSPLRNLLIAKNRAFQKMAAAQATPPLPIRPVQKISISKTTQALPQQKYLTLSPAPLLSGQKIVISPSAQRLPLQKTVNSPPTLIQKVTTPESYYALYSKQEGRMPIWAPCKLVETIPLSKDTATLYRVQFFENSVDSNKIVKGNEVASNKVDPKLKIGARVIAQLISSKNKYKRFVPGVIGEKLSKYNNQRYLVFFDYGPVHYVTPEEVREVLESSEKVWNDVHENLRLFIFEYLQSQTKRQRALLNVRPNQQLPVERRGAWSKAVVIEIDCSLVKMRFREDNNVEWIYRGSKRLGPLYNQGSRKENMNARRNDPNISYITIDDDEFDQTSMEQENEVAERSEKSQTARKSTSMGTRNKMSVGPLQPASSTQASSGANQPIILNDNNIYLEEPKQITKFRHFTPRANIASKKYVAHDCSPACLTPSPNLTNHSPLSKPLLTCWERLIVRQKNNRWVQYKAPCGRRLRNMYEIRIYLMVTRCALNVDNFDFDVNIQVLHAYDVIDKNLCPLYMPDMSEGKEGMKIPVINAFDDTRPPKLEYSAVRIPMNGVKINTDPEFMACCDCTDDCADKTKCACFQMTIQGYNYANRGENTEDDVVSYVWKRLQSVVTTGIYECNSRCKCTNRCLNKVVQNPIQVKMQLYRTKNRGWGLESCHDIPKGAFICIYAGRLYREDDANALCQGEDHGDEYFAELDLIETAQPLKEGFEAGVINEDSDTDEEKASDSDSDYDESKAREDEDFTTPRKAGGSREIVTRSLRDKRGSINEPSSNNSDSDDEMVNMVPTAGNANGAQQKGNRSLRKLYGKNEKVYIMDAKLCGNVGRYFNHSCDPNLMVQSVFVDTHDMRFPWIAFFAMRVIKAGEELTWNYNYEVGSVPSKCMYCKCGAKNCRGRIL